MNDDQHRYLGSYELDLLEIIRKLLPLASAHLEETRQASLSGGPGAMRAWMNAREAIAEARQEIGDKA